MAVVMRDAYRRTLTATGFSYAEHMYHYECETSILSFNVYLFLKHGSVYHWYVLV